MDTFNFSDKATMHTAPKNDSTPQMPANVHLVPRHITFTSDESSVMHDATKLRTELEQITREKNDTIENLKMELAEKSETMANMQPDLAAKTKLFEDLLEDKKEIERKLDDVRVCMIKSSAYEMTLRKKDEELNNSIIKIKHFELELETQNQDVEYLRIVLSEKDERIQKFREDLALHQNKCKENERMLADLERLKLLVTSYNDVMAEK